MTTIQNDVVRYIVKEYYDGNVAKAAEETGFARAQLAGWMEGINRPQKSNVGWLMHKAFSPEFMVIAEYVPIETSGSEDTVGSQIRKILKGHEKASGIYAFYDSMANLIYIGKSDGNLSEECANQLKASLKSGVFPKGAAQPKRRLDVVKYVSAYYVRGSDFEDYAKHVESLILRISKPVLNANIGHLQKVY